MQIKHFDDLQQVEVIHRMAGQMMRISVYFIDGLLIDTGPSRKKEQLLPVFNDLPIDRVVCTHHHEDHTGLAYWLSEQKQLPIYMHALGKKICMKEAKMPLYRRLYWGERRKFQATEIGETLTTENYTWDVIHTPGHADDHISLYNREKKWMFGGDLYVHPTPKSMFGFESLPVMIASLEKLLTYDFDVYVCSHAGVIQEGRKAIEHKLSYLRKTQAEIRSLYGSGLDPRAIRKQLFPKKHRLHYLSLFENSPQHLIRSALK